MTEAFELVREANRRELAGAPQALREMLDLVGLDSLASVVEEAGEEAERLLAERESARAARDFARADQIRDLLARKTPAKGTLRFCVTEILAEPDRVGDGKDALLAELMAP